MKINIILEKYIWRLVNSAYSFNQWHSYCNCIVLNLCVSCIFFKAAFIGFIGVAYAMMVIVVRIAPGIVRCVFMIMPAGVRVSVFSSNKYTVPPESPCCANGTLSQGTICSWLLKGMAPTPISLLQLASASSPVLLASCTFPPVSPDVAPHLYTSSCFRRWSSFLDGLPRL